MKSQTILHIETAISHLKAAFGKTHHEEIATMVTWMEDRSNQIDGDWSDMELESELLYAIAKVFFKRLGVPVSE